MRWTGVIILLVVVLSNSCADQPMTTPSQTTWRATDRSAGDGFPDSAEFANANVPAGMLTLSTQGAFLNGYTQWRGLGTAHFENVNDISITESVQVRDGAGGVINSGVQSAHIVRFGIPINSGDTSLIAPISTNNRTCGLLGKHSIAGSVAQKFQLGNAEIVAWQMSLQHDGTDVLEPICAAPVAKLRLGFGTASGEELNLSLPAGSNAYVSIDGSQSTKGESGGSDIISYAWTIGGSAAGNSAAFSHSFTAPSTSVSLNVTDGDGATAWAAGDVNIEFENPCDDPLTDETEWTCDWRSSGDQVDYGGETVEDVETQAEAHNICTLTDWYVWNGYSWTYTDTTVDECHYEYY